MTSSHLRIGNLLQRKRDGIVIDVKEVLINRILYVNPDLTSIKAIAAELNGFEPIILTEYWLIRLGAKKEVLDAGGGIGFYDSYSIGAYELTHVYKNMWGILGTKCSPIKYVHQMQNLYFALTNQELTII